MSDYIDEIEKILDEAVMTLSADEYEELIDRLREDGYGI